MMGLAMSRFPTAKFALRSPTTTSVRGMWVRVVTSATATAVWAIPTAFRSPNTGNNSHVYRVKSDGDVSYDDVSRSYGVIKFL